MSLYPEAESSTELVNALVGHTSNNEIHGVVLENGKDYGYRPVFFLQSNPSISKKIWWSLFNTEVAERKADNRAFTRNFLNHNLDQDQFLAVLSIDSYGYRHQAFKTSGLPVVDEKTAKKIISSSWFDREMQVSWLKSGTAPAILVRKWLDTWSGVPKIVERIIKIDKKENVWPDLEPDDLDKTRQQRYEELDKGGRQSIVYNSNTLTYLERELSGAENKPGNYLSLSPKLGRQHKRSSTKL